ncbi:MAG: HEAT repeat domain-containing protein [Deltaproteobacteria bacterium]|nr:HEAT repeat domain-containing protein [Deltaproteobacteria bacterium]
MTAALCADRGAAWAGPADEKVNVCTITINSDDEKKMFKAQLNPKEFRFIELTSLPGGGDSELGWFDFACRSGIKCDLLLISGHFGGSFFGSSHLTLGLDEIERHSCRRDCRGILENPREVFLFGCNTLATKDTDGRTPEQYYDVLLEENIAPADAERVVAERYGALGPSNRDRMRYAFDGVPHVYGYTRVGPVGKNVSPSLGEYLRSKKDYADYLAKDATSQLVSGLTRVNREYEYALRQFPILECSGISAGSPDAELKENICFLYNEGAPVVDRLTKVRELMLSSKYLNTLPAIQAFFKLHPPAGYTAEEKSKFAALATLEKPRQQMSELLDKIQMPGLRLDLAKFTRDMGWVSDEAYAKLRHETILGALSPPFTQLKKQAVCSLHVTASTVAYSELHESSFSSSIGLAQLACLAPTDPKIQAEAAHALSNRDPKVRAAAATLLWKSNAPLPTQHAELAARLDDPDKDVRIAACYALAGLKPKDTGIQLALARKLRDRDPYIREMAQYALSEIKPQNAEVLREIRAVVPDFR